jgi:hypothetical protein
MGDNEQAAAAFQRAIAVDRQMQNSEFEALDWLAYGRFLFQIGAPPRLTAACFLRARRGLEARPGPELEEVEQSIKTARDLFGDGVVDGVARDPEPAEQEALAFVPPPPVTIK